MDISKAESQSNENKSLTRWRNLIAFWILGLCNNYGFTIVVSAAKDILHDQFNDGANSTWNDGENLRDCNQLSTGAMLLANILPCLIVKCTVPFMPFYVRLRITVCVVTSALGLLSISLGGTKFLTIFGVVLGSISTGLGEISILPYLHKYAKENITSWSSGTGASGIVAATAYTALKTILSTENTILVMLIVPIAQAIAFGLILVPPNDKLIVNADNEDKQQPPKKTILKKISLLPRLWIYYVPLGLVYFFEFFINMGMYELVQFDNIWLDSKAQYRWLHTVYQVGVFISRSSTTFITFDKIWPMTVFQFVNVLYFGVEVIYYVTPSIWIVFAITLWEGLLGGGAYVNTFCKMSDEIRPDDLRDSLGIVTFADALGITLASWAAIGVHPKICQMPRPTNRFQF